MDRMLLPTARATAVSPKQVARARQHAQLLRGVHGTSFAETAEWLGAMQAQDLASGLWSLGIRVPGTTESDVVGALERGEVLRTWPMRGTIHVVSSQDARWMLDLTGSRSLAASESRRNQLGFDRSVADRACAVLEAALRVERRLTRPEALARLDAQGIDTSGQRGYHLLWYAAVTGLTCIGPQVGKQQSVVLLDQWAPHQRGLARAEAIVELTWRFFRSHGPATESDFAGWAGLPLTTVRAGITANADRLVAVPTPTAELILSRELDETIASGTLRASPSRVLPGFDEFVLGYKDRSAQLPPSHFTDVVPGGNGMFRNTLCIDGQIVGTWQRTIRARHVDVTLSPFSPLSTRQLAGVRRAVADFGRYLGREIRISDRP